MAIRTFLRPSYQPRTWQRMLQRLAALRPCSWALSHLLPHMDGWMLRRTHDKHSISTLLTGLPLITLTTTGAHSGQPRHTSLAAIPQDEHIVLVASNFGNPHHPAWYYNLVAHPEVQVSLNGQTGSYLARLTSGAEREACWRLAASLYPGFEAYRRRARGREIPVVVLTPLPQQGEGDF